MASIEVDAKNEVQWSQYINFCQKKLNEKLIKCKANETPKTPPKFEIGSEVSPILEKKEAKKEGKEELKKEEQKKEEPKKEESKKDPKKEEATIPKENTKKEEEDYII